MLQEGVNFFRKTSTNWSYQYGGRRTAVVHTEPQALEIRNLIFIFLEEGGQILPSPAVNK